MKKNGSDFVFYSPHPLTGLSQTDLKCTDFGRYSPATYDAWAKIRKLFDNVILFMCRSLHIVVDALQRRSCPMPAKQNYVVVPYASPHVRVFLVPNDQVHDVWQVQESPWSSWHQTDTTELTFDELQFVEDQGAWPAKSRLLYFLGGCGHASYGKRMRSLLVKLVRQSTITNMGYADDVFVRCNEDENLPGQVCQFDAAFLKRQCWIHDNWWFLQAHNDLRQSMRRSVFCFVLPGDTASSRRLTEIVLAGCIPVFIGPPWSSMPLADKVDYTQIALFFQLADFQ